MKHLHHSAFISMTRYEKQSIQCKKQTTKRYAHIKYAKLKKHNTIAYIISSIHMQ